MLMYCTPVLHPCRDTDCRMLADLLYRILTKKDGSPGLKSQIKVWRGNLGVLKCGEV